jgi:hypothetical protein
MQEFYKKPNFYFILIPAIATLWAVLTWAVSAPTAAKEWTRAQEDYKQAQAITAKIMALDPERLDYEKQKGKSAQFDYGITVEKYARQWKIPTSDYSLTSGREMKRGGQRTKGASLQIKPIDVATFTQFLSSMMYRWPDLQVDQLKLTKQKDGKDSWKVDIKLTYYY